MQRLLFLVFCLFLLPFSSFANDIDGVRFELIPGKYEVDANTAYAGFSISMEPGWHVYWRSPGEGGLPPKFTAISAQNVSAMNVEWPAPKEFLTNDAVSVGYEGNVVIPIRLGVANPGEPVLLELEVDVFGCSIICVPFKEKVSVVLTAETNASTASKTDGWLSRVPTSSTNSLNATLDVGKATLSVPLKGAALGVDQPVLDLGDDFVGRFQDLADNRAVFQIRRVTDKPLEELASGAIIAASETGFERHSFTIEAAQPIRWSIILVALMGGLVLNIMPCVLPVLALKLAGFAKHSSHRRASFLWTGIGIVVSFILLGAAAALLKACGESIGWGVQFQNPVFLGAMTLITALFAISLLDGFMIRLPYSWMDGLSSFGRGEGKVASLSQGLVATLLATPCSAPFVGTAVGFAFTSDVMTLMLIFVAMGLGMAMPYLLICFIPSSRALVPMSGSWMIKLKVFLSLGLIATSGALVAFLGYSNPLVAVAMMLVICSMVAFLVRPRVLAFFVATAFVVIAAINYPMKAETHDGDIWQSFDEQKISQFVSEGKTVVVDVTAAWCITCKVNDRVTFGSDDVVAALKRDDVIAMRADWTQPNEAISAYLAKFNRYGIPFTVIYSKSHKDGKPLPELLTPTLILNALETQP